MRLSQFHLATVKEVPADAELASHRLMLRSGMIRRLAAGIYTWSPLGLKVLRKVEAIVREEMNAIGALEMLMPAIQPRELWEETGRWEKFGGQLLKIQDRKAQAFCFGPTHEEVITDFVRNEFKSYKQLPCCFYQIQSKFRDEIRPRFGVMRAREFLMKDAYSFHLDETSLNASYSAMYGAYTRIFTRLGLVFRAVEADTGAIGGHASHEFQVLADSGEDIIACSDGSDYAANIEKAIALTAATARPAPSQALALIATPEQTTCEAVAALLQRPLAATLKTLAFADEQGLVLFLLRGDHTYNEIKAAKLPPLADRQLRLASEAELRDYLGVDAAPGFLGPLQPQRPILVVADHAAARLADFVIGANRAGYHYHGVNWGRDLPEPDLVADIRHVEAGDPSPDGQGQLQLIRGIEVGHIFQLGSSYAQALKASVPDAEGRDRTLLMGCYGIGISRIVAAAIEQSHDQAGIIWPSPMAPWQVAICIINPKREPEVATAAEALYQRLLAEGFEVVLDDRGLRPGTMFADMELIGIPQRVIVSARGLAADTYEYRERSAEESINMSEADLLQKLRQKYPRG